MMTRMDAMEVAQRRGIVHVVQDISDDEAESKTTREEPKEHVTMEERMIRAIGVLEVNLNLILLSILEV
jgi:hypothetical protein